MQTNFIGELISLLWTHYKTDPCVDMQCIFNRIWMWVSLGWVLMHIGWLLHILRLTNPQKGSSMKTPMTDDDWIRLVLLFRIILYYTFLEIQIWERPQKCGARTLPLCYSVWVINWDNNLKFYLFTYSKMLR